jgi:cytochrome P450 family 6
VVNGGKISYENVLEMKFLSNVINGEFDDKKSSEKFKQTFYFTETLRMYPPVPLLIRKANFDYKIPDSSHVIHKGQQIIIPLVAFHYDERFWKEPESFFTERFLN